MMGTVLYECTGELNRGVLIPFMMILGGILSYRADPKRFPRPAMIVFITISALVGGFILVDQVDQYNKIVVAYQNGDYQIVEGYVENFHPMPESGHDHEHFEIDGTYFEYSDFTAQQGYHNALSRGGVITGNGQHLRIGYIEMDSATGNQMLDNVIVYIEELP